MLTFEEDSVKTFIQDHKHALNAIEIPNGWGCGPIIGNFEGLQGKFFALLGKTARTPGQYPGHAIEMTNEHFHPIVRVRKFKVPDYKPAALGEFQLEEPHGESGWKWTKKGVGSIPEYIMSAETKLSIAYMDEENTVTGYGSMESVSRLICPTDVLAWLK
jgi:hypothetical protein